jgi:hypothetical protein
LVQKVIPAPQVQVVIRALLPQAMVVTKDLPVLRDLRVLLEIEVHKVLWDQRALPPQVLKETKVQLVLKDLRVELQVLAQWVQ